MTVTSTLILRLVCAAVAGVCAFFLFDPPPDDIDPWLAVAVVVGIIGALFPYPWPSD